MKTPLDPLTLKQIPDSKRVREEKIPSAISNPKRAAQPQHPAIGQGTVTPLEKRFPESDELHLLELQVSAYLLETALTAADLPVGEAASIRKSFCGRIFDLQDLRAAIDASQAPASGHRGASNAEDTP